MTPWATEKEQGPLSGSHERPLAWLDGSIGLTNVNQTTEDSAGRFPGGAARGASFYTIMGRKDFRLFTQAASDVPHHNYYDEYLVL